MLIYLHYVPRAQELRTLTLVEGIPAGETVDIGLPNRQNVLTFYEDGSVKFFIMKYKTDQCYGPAKIRVPSDSSIYYYLKPYINQFRNKLLVGATTFSCSSTLEAKSFPVRALSPSTCVQLLSVELESILRPMAFDTP